MTVLLAVTMFGGAAPRAQAHICTNPVEINVGEQVLVNIGVASEDKPVNAVDIDIPAGFDLKDQIGYLGWVGTRVGNVAHFEGAQMTPYGCTFFTLKGTAPTKGVYIADITVHATDGTSKEYIDKNPYSPYPAMGIYAGVLIPDGGVTPGGKPEDGRNLVVTLAVALIAGGVAVAFAVVLNRRRAAND